jgi:carbamoyl-phosphate synthase small subunit
VVEVTSQNHGFAVDGPTLTPGEFELTHFSGNDQTLEGMVHRSLPVLSCQYHPEASPGPHDSRPWFRAFADQVARARGESTLVASGGVMKGAHAP